MKKFIVGVAAALLAATLFFPCSAISAESAILIDGQTGRVIFEKQPDKHSLIASTTKIMTALVVCEQTNVLDRVRIPKEAVGIEGSSMYLREGEILTVQDLLYGLMLRSGNDAAVALAIYCGGTVEGFAELMNDKAHRLGMKNSHFVNPNGLDAPDHYSTARDLAVLAAYAMDNPIFAKTASTKSVTIGNRVLQNHNKLLWLLEGADGVKTGFTKAAGRILVSSCVRNGRRLIAVTLNDRNDWRDHQDLLEHGFSDYNIVQIVKKGQCVGSVSILSGEKQQVELIADSDFFYALSPYEQVEWNLPDPGFAYAPVARGQSAGDMYFCIEKRNIGKIPLVYGQTIEMKEYEKPSAWKRFFKGG